MQIFANFESGEMMTYDEYLQAVRQQVMHDLQQCYSLSPIYRGDLDSEADCDEETENLPLIYVWIEKLGADQGRCILSVNKSLVGLAIAAYVSRQDGIFGHLLDSIVNDLSRMCTGAFQYTMKHFGLTPEETCEALSEFLAE